MSITFKDLENFVACAESKTLSEAAEKLEMAQPSLSLGLKKLETELDYKLFLRGRSGLKLSPQGKALLPEAKELLKGLNKIKGHKTALKFKIGCHPSVGMFVLGQFLKVMHKELPHIDFEIVNSSSHDIHKLTTAGEIDFGVVMNPAASQGLIIKTVGVDHVHVWESKNRYQDKIILNPKIIQTHSILSRWKSCPEQRIEVENLELIAHLTNSGAGYGIIPSQVVKSQGLNLTKVANTPHFKDHLGLLCYPEMLKSQEGRIIFEALKKSYETY